MDLDLLFLLDRCSTCSGKNREFLSERLPEVLSRRPDPASRKGSDRSIRKLIPDSCFLLREPKFLLISDSMMVSGPRFSFQMGFLQLEQFII